MDGLTIRKEVLVRTADPQPPVKGLRCEQERWGQAESVGVGMWNWNHTRYCTEWMRFFGLDNGAHCGYPTCALSEAERVTRNRSSRRLSTE